MGEGDVVEGSDEEKLSSPTSTHFVHRIGFRCLLLLGGCFIAGGISWMLGSTLIPWVPVWLPAGIGFVALLRWGLNYWPIVALGGVAANSFLFIEAGTRLERLIGISSGALGLVVGAATGAVLAQRLINWPEDMRTGKGTVRLVFSGSLIGPLVSTLIIFPSWWWIGAVPENAAVLFCLILFFSSAIGVTTLGLPLLMVAPIFEGDWSRRRLLLLIPMPVALVGALFLLSYVDSSARKQIEFRFDRSVGDINSTIQEQLIQHLEMLQSMRSFWESSDWVSRREFHQFTKRGILRHEGLVLLGWSPQVQREEEDRLQADLERIVRMAPANRRPAWFSPSAGEVEPDSLFPLWYLVPKANRENFLGVDLFKDEVLRPVMEKSMSDGSVTAAMPVVEGDSGRHLFFSCLWVPEKNRPSAPGDEWLQNRGGFVLSLIDLDRIVRTAIEESLSAIGSEEVVLLIQNESEDSELVYYFNDDGYEGEGLYDYDSVRVIAFADQLWQARYVPMRGVFGQLINWQIPSAQAGVYLVSALLGILLLTATGYAVRIENDVKVRTRELASSEERFRQLSETVSEVFWIFSVETSKFEYVSPSFETVWLESPSAVCEDPFVWYYTIREIDRKPARDGFERALRGEGNYDVEYCIERKDGQEIWIRDRGFSVKNSDGEVIRIVGVADDITEARKAQQELIRSNADLERFAYLASHDLQEPLRMVTSFVQLLQKRYSGELGEDADEYISHAVSGAERMRRLINGLLALSRIDSRDLRPEEISSTVLVGDAIDDLKLAIEESGAEVKVGGNLPMVFGARAQLTQVFQNLIGNAIKYTSPDRSPVIQISARDREGMVEFAVRDNGPGIDETDFDRIFEIFQRLRAEQDGKGTGIGLSLCRRIVERHGGRMWVESDLGKGSCFRFTVPFQRTSENQSRRD